MCLPVKTRYRESLKNMHPRQKAPPPRSQRASNQPHDLKWSPVYKLDIEWLLFQNTNVTEKKRFIMFQIQADVKKKQKTVKSFLSCLPFFVAPTSSNIHLNVTGMTFFTLWSNFIRRWLSFLSLRFRCVLENRQQPITRLNSTELKRKRCAHFYFFFTILYSVHVQRRLPVNSGPMNTKKKKRLDKELNSSGRLGNMYIR